MIVSLAQPVDELWILQGNPQTLPIELTAPAKRVFWLQAHVTSDETSLSPSPLLKMDGSAGLCITWHARGSFMKVSSYRQGQLAKETRSPGPAVMIDLSCAGKWYLQVFVQAKGFDSPVQEQPEGDLRLGIHCQGTAAQGDSYLYFGGPMELWRGKHRLAFDEGIRPSLLCLPDSMLSGNQENTGAPDTILRPSTPNPPALSPQRGSRLESAIYYVQGFLDSILRPSQENLVLEIDPREPSRIWAVVVLALAAQRKMPKYRFTETDEREIHWRRLMQNLALPLARPQDYDAACILKDSDFQNLFAQVPDYLKMAIVELGLVPSTLAQQALGAE